MNFDFLHLYNWASGRRKELLYGTLTFSLCLLAVLSTYFKFRGNQDSAYFQARQAFQLWTGAKEDKDQAFAFLKKKAAKFSAVQSRFDALIAQHLLYSKNLKEASSYANAALGRIKIADSFYTSFSKTALTIARGAIAEALDESRMLRSSLEKEFNSMKSENSFAPRKHTLYALNLIRIASLEKQLGHEGGELEALVAIERSLDQFSELRVFLQQQLKEGDFSFYEYIKIRKRQLATS